MDNARPLPLVLLNDREAFWARSVSPDLCWRELAGLVLFVCLATAAYGTVLAGWRSPRLALYVAVKLPVLFLGTTAIVALFNWILATLLGSGLSFKTCVFTVFGAMTIGGWILLALLPVALFFLLCAMPAAGSHHELQFAHNAILMTHIVLLATAGFFGNAALLLGLRRLVPSASAAPRLFLGWILAFAFTGTQLSWILRPFVGSPFYPIKFLRPDALDRNFYEFIFTEVLPFLLAGGK